MYLQHTLSHSPLGNKFVFQSILSALYYSQRRMNYFVENNLAAA